MKVGIIPARHKPLAGELALQLAALCEARGVTPLLTADAADRLDRPDLAAPEDDLACADTIVTLTGDGGVLAAARLAAPYKTPILAVDLGRLGFLSAVRPDDIEAAFERLLSDGYDCEERMMLDARVYRGASTPQLSNDSSTFSEVGGSIGLNDAVVAKSALARVLRLTITVADDVMAETRADGLVISTPTGSTAYALAAGGPIVHPDVPLLLICPICAHSLAQRPIVVSPDEEVEIRAEWEGDEVASEYLEAMLTIDGQVGVRLYSGDVVKLRRSERVARLLRVPGDSFYDRLREKMRWGK